MGLLNLLFRISIIYEPPLCSVLAAVQCCPSDSESGVVRGQRRVARRISVKCHVQRSVCSQQSGRRTHVRIMQSSGGLAAPAPGVPRPSTAAVSPDLRSPTVAWDGTAWPWSAVSYCQFTSLLWLTFTSAGDAKSETEVRSSDIAFRLFYR